MASPAQVYLKKLPFPGSFFTLTWKQDFLTHTRERFCLAATTAEHNLPVPLVRPYFIRDAQECQRNHTREASHVVLRDGLWMARAETCFGFKEVLGFISIIGRNCHSGACCWFRPSGHWSNNLLTEVGIKKSKVFGSFSKWDPPSEHTDVCVDSLFCPSGPQPTLAQG